MEGTIIAKLKTAKEITGVNICTFEMEDGAHYSCSMNKWAIEGCISVFQREHSHPEYDYYSDHFYVKKEWLKEVEDYEKYLLKIPIDTKMIIQGMRAHYVGLIDGKPCYWRNGKTSHTAQKDEYDTFEPINMNNIKFIMEEEDNE